MNTYEILDTIADIYNPTLFLGFLVMSVIYWRGGDRLASFKGLLGLIVAYALMFIDNATGLWPALGLDYSTHSAVALALIIFHVHKKHVKSKPALALLGSLVGYYILEVYQEYHTAADIVSTAAVVGALIGPVYWLFGKLHKEGS